jgi:D-threo-aldose 1-dehydrogenase
MRYRPLGSTGLKVSELVFGGGWVGGVLIHQKDEVKLAVLRRAMEAGINWIDTAPSYGKGKSEEALGWLLTEIEDEPYLSTKVMLDTANLKDTPGQVEKSIQESLRRLDRESVDLLQLHNPIELKPKENSISVDDVLKKGGAADALEKLRDQGVTSHIGFTALGDAETVKKVIDSGRFETAQVYYNMLNPSAGRAMPKGWTGHDFGWCRRYGRSRLPMHS